MPILYRDVLVEPHGSAYDLLLGFCAERSKTCSLVQRKPDQAEHFLSLAQAHLVESRLTASWPGTELIGPIARIHVFALSAGMLELLSTRCRRLYGWLQPDLLEDLATFRQDGSVVLGSIAHEGESWLEITEEEARGLSIASLKLGPPRPAQI